MADQIPKGYTWIRDIDPNAIWNQDDRTIETKYKIYQPDEYIIINDKAYVQDPYVNKYKNPHKVEGLQHDPSQIKFFDFKQDYTVLIRKKTFYAITQGNEENYLEVFQINNFTGLRTSHNVYGKGNASVTIRGGTKVIVAGKQQVNKKWKNFDELLNGWNNIDQEQYGQYKGIQYNDLQRTREKVYDWAYAEKCAFEPMDEIYIFAKSPHKDKSGEYPFVQIFFGYISSVQKQYQAGQGGPTITISADDHLKLLSISRISNRVPKDMTVTGTSFRFDGAGNFIVESDWRYNGINLESLNPDGSFNPATSFVSHTFSNVFAGKSVYEIIQRCCIEAGIPFKYLLNRIEKIKRIPFTPQLQPTNFQELFTGDFKDRLSFCKDGAQRLNLEFFADEQGNIVLKIPNYNVGINRLKDNNLGIDAPVIYDQNFNRVIKLDTLVITSSEPERYYVTLKEESLYDIARNFLNNGALWPQLWELNPFITDTNFIPAGTKLLISKSEDTTTQVDKNYIETVKVQKSNTLSELTDKYIPVIYPEKIVSFSFVDSDKEIYTSAQVTVDVPFLQSKANAVPPAITRTAADFELIKKFGFKAYPSSGLNPIIADARGAAIYASFLIIKSLAMRYTGSLTIIEDATIKVGNPVRLLLYDENPFHELYDFKNGNDNSMAQAIFYVDAIERTVSPTNVSYMTLTLKAGRMMGMPSIYDKCQELYRYFYEDVQGDISLSPNDPQNKVNTQSEEESYADYQNGSKGVIHAVLTRSQALELDKKYQDKHLLNFSIGPAETVQKIASIVYEDNDAQKIIDANKGLPDGLGGVFDEFLTRLYPGQKIRIPYSIQTDKYPKEFIDDYLK